MQDELQEMKTDIALIKADIKQINKFFAKVEGSIDMMSEISTQVAVQHEIIKNTVDKLEDLDNIVEEHRKEEAARTEAIQQRLEEYRKSAYDDHLRLSEENKANRNKRHAEMMAEIRSNNDVMMRRMDEQNKRIRSLENWKYYLAGMGAVVIFLLAKVVNLGGFFG